MKYVLNLLIALLCLQFVSTAAGGQPPYSKEAVALADRLVGHMLNDEVLVKRVYGNLNRMEDGAGKPLAQRYKMKVQANFKKSLPELKVHARGVYLQLYTLEEMRVLEQFHRHYPGLLAKNDEASYRVMYRACEIMTAVKGATR